jgi:hypothetical protein
MADFFSVPTRARVERMIRIIKAVLDGRECSLNCRDRDLYEYMKEWATGNVPRYYGELFDQVPKPEGTPA